MQKVLLVDDEILVRIGMKSIINWEEHGYTIMAEAACGEEAIEKIKRDRPDIVLTDLIMEPMDGFELIPWIKKEYPLIKVVVLSCHNDFHHVKEAMRLGADDYIFKLTIKPLELLETLAVVSRTTVDEQVIDVEISSDKVVHYNLDALKSKLIIAAIQKTFTDTKQWLDEMKQLGCKMELQQPYVVFYVSADEFELPNEHFRIKEKELLKFSMLNFSAEVFELFELMEVFDYHSGDILLVTNSEEANYAALTRQFETSFRLLQEYMSRYLGITISAGISGVHSGLSAFQMAVDEAQTAMNTRFYNGFGHISCYNKLPTAVDSEGEPLQQLDVDKLEYYTELLDYPHAESILVDYFQYLKQCHTASIRKVRERMLDLLLPFVSVARKRSLSLDEILANNQYHPQQVINYFESIERIEAWFLQFTQQFIQYCSRQHMQRYKTRDEVIKVKQFVNDTYMLGAISLSDAAAHVNMSESYFSSLFKKETGSSFIDYVNQVKMERAKQLLLQTNLKIYEIAEQIGIDNANYFSLLFKKLIGVSPADYRN